VDTSIDEEIAVLREQLDGRNHELDKVLTPRIEAHPLTLRTVVDEVVAAHRRIGDTMEFGLDDTANLFSRVLKPAARRAGAEWAGFHTLRHSCATNLFRRGLNAKQVQVWLGHHSPAFTLATYVHLLPDDAPDPAFLETLLTRRPGEGVDQVDSASG